MLEDRRDSELARRFIVLEQVIRALRAEFEERHVDVGGGRLRCAECGTLSVAAGVGWRAYIGYDVRDQDPPEVFTLCPECASREFGEE